MKHTRRNRIAFATSGLIPVVLAASSGMAAATATSTTTGERHKFVQEMKRLEEGHATAHSSVERMSQQHDAELSLQQHLIRAATRSERTSRVLDNGYNANYGNFYYRNFNQGDGYDYDESSIPSNINMTEYSLKYVGCSNVKSWDDDLASDETTASPLALHQYAVLRLCLHDQCSAYNQFGCNYQYGEYLLPLADYLAIMTQFHLQQYQRYCAVCTECLTWTQTTSSSSSGSDDYYSDGDVSSSYGYDDNNADGYNRRLQNNNYNRPWFIQDDGTCIFSTSCQNYASVCASYSESTPSYQAYLKCSAFNVGNMVGYVGPHCKSDGHSIGIGLYEDENCYQYIGDEGNSIGQYLHADGDGSSKYSDSELAPFYDKSCISCSNNRNDGQYILQRDSSSSSSGYGGYNGNGGNNNQNSNVYPLCYQIYGHSAKCNRHLAGYADSYDVSAACVTVARPEIIH
jgi:hypothetical protein